MTTLVETRDRDLVVDLRREFHRHPELAFEEFETAKRVAAVLGEAGLEVRAGLAGTGVLGVLRGANPGQTMLIRADMDALPIQEADGRSYGSVVPGKMHACGH
ncbi:MAG: M20/M25/M40 family metallo-hydrolase, partial [Chloroflexota bacterium]